MESVFLIHVDSSAFALSATIQDRNKDFLHWRTTSKHLTYEFWPSVHFLRYFGFCKVSINCSFSLWLEIIQEFYRPMRIYSICKILLQMEKVFSVFSTVIFRVSSPSPSLFAKSFSLDPPKEKEERSIIRDFWRAFDARILIGLTHRSARQSSEIA